MWVWRSQQWCEQTLQSADQHVGLATTLRELGNLRIFHSNLPAQKIILSLKGHDIARIFWNCRRVLSRQVGAGRGTRRDGFSNNWRGDIGRGWSRHVVLAS